MQDITLNCPLSCTKCETSLKTPLTCYKCDETQNLEINNLTNTCQKIKNPQTLKNPEIQIPENPSKIPLTKKISKIFSGIFFSFYPAGLIIMCYLKLLYKSIFKEFIFLASLFTFVHYLLTYLLLAYSINSLSGNQLNFIIIAIFLFLLTNSVFSLGMFARGKNKVMENVKIFGFKSNHMLLAFFYCVFGSGIALWVGIFQFSNIYSKLLIEDFQVKKFKKLYKIILFFNLIFVMAETLAISVVFFAFVEISAKLVYYYMASGAFCCFVYFLLVFKDNKNFEFSKTGFSSEKERVRILDRFGRGFEKLEEETDVEFFESLEDGDIKQLFSRFQEFGKSI